MLPLRYSEAAASQALSIGVTTWLARVIRRREYLNRETAGDGYHVAGRCFVLAGETWLPLSAVWTLRDEL